MHRRLSRVFAFALAPAILALSACGTDDTGDADRPPAVALSVSPSDTYYDLTHPDPAATASDVADDPPVGFSAPALTPFEVYYRQTHPQFTAAEPAQRARQCSSASPASSPLRPCFQ
jgi:hypothetical protein